jgi:hypothetical protein
MTTSITTLSRMPLLAYAEVHYAEYRYTESHNAKRCSIYHTKVQLFNYSNNLLIIENWADIRKAIYELLTIKIKLGISSA